MAKLERYPSYTDCIAQTLRQSREPMTVESLLAGVEGQRPVSKNARNAVFRALEQMYQAVPVSSTRYGWLPYLLSENVFRHPLMNEEARRGFLLLDELEHAAFFPEFFQDRNSNDRAVVIDLLGGPVINAQMRVERKIWSLQLGAEFTTWVDEQGGMGRDDILITVLDAVNGRYSVRLQPREAKDLERVDKRNKQLATLATKIVIDDAQADVVGMPIWALAARLIGRGLYRNPVPPDELHLVLHKQSPLIVDREGRLFHKDHMPLLDTPETLWDEDEDDDLSSARAMRSMFDFITDDTNIGRKNRKVEVRSSVDEFADWEDDPFSAPEKKADVDPFADFDDACEAYSAYLVAFHEAEAPGAPMPHDDFHLLEAELQMLVELEQEFGLLLPEQSTRKEELADRLFIDPEVFLDPDWDDPDYSDFDEPPFWQN